ncbi:hypothetical protein [Streptomyces sp. WAC06614]|uniref:hypothetical protein n=1 Tax=Streptomyces sp. WAC06614 TaxID=2487416 RepID=UPI000F772525|nr:hypothetical protein [Streptomyces sp. WAC06614]RSS82926.1 hypothetical protein EF918_05255 [Streptomyces sp. WAC06614]
MPIASSPSRRSALSAAALAWAAASGSVLWAASAPTQGSSSRPLLGGTLPFLEGRRLSPHDYRLFTRLNDLILAGSATRELIPLRDRSFELFGDEKFLDGIHDAKWVTDGLLSIDTHLRAYLTPEPLNIIELGPAPWLLIVENTATFDNLRRILRQWPCPHEVGWIAFGDGDRIAASITTLPERLSETGHPLTEILYYGDLDYDGLHCVTLASQRSVAAGLPPLTPASGLYAALLTCARRSATAIAPDAARTVSTWLPAPLAARTTLALSSGTVVRQEALQLTTLSRRLVPAHGDLRWQLAAVPPTRTGPTGRSTVNSAIGTPRRPTGVSKTEAPGPGVSARFCVPTLRGRG